MAVRISVVGKRAVVATSMWLIEMIFFFEKFSTVEFYFVFTQKSSKLICNILKFLLYLIKYMYRLNLTIKVQVILFIQNGTDFPLISITVSYYLCLYGIFYKWRLYDDTTTATRHKLIYRIDLSYESLNLHSLMSTMLFSPFVWPTCARQ